MATFKALNLADQIASNLALRLKGKTSAGGDVAVVRTNSVIGGGTVVHPLITVGTGAFGANTDSASIYIVPEQMSATGVASNVGVNSIGLAQEVYAPHVAMLIIETRVDGFFNEFTKFAIYGELAAAGVKVDVYTTANGTAPVLASARTFKGSFVLDQYNPLTNQI